MLGSSCCSDSTVRRLRGVAALILLLLTGLGVAAAVVLPTGRAARRPSLGRLAVAGLSAAPSVPRVSTLPTSSPGAVADAAAHPRFAPAAAPVAPGATVAPAAPTSPAPAAAVAPPALAASPAPAMPVAPPDACTVALESLAAHANPAFAFYCRPGPLNVGVANAVSYICVPRSASACPDGRAEIIIADPTCAATYENEASNSYWDFAAEPSGVIAPGTVQGGRTWDPYGGCPEP